MKLSDWAKQNGLSYRTAHRLWKSNKLPCRAEQLATGTILVYPESKKDEKVVLYARVSSQDQKEDVERQIGRLRDYCSANGLTIEQEVSEIGSGLNGNRAKLLKILKNSQITCIVVEHKDRFSRFGFEMVKASLEAAGRTIRVMNESECKDDLVQDFIDIVTSMCSRIYGRRSAKNRAKKAIEAAQSND